MLEKLPFFLWHIQLSVTSLVVKIKKNVKGSAFCSAIQWHLFREVYLYHILL